MFTMDFTKSVLVSNLTVKMLADMFMCVTNRCIFTRPKTFLVKRWLVEKHSIPPSAIFAFLYRYTFIYISLSDRHFMCFYFLFQTSRGEDEEEGELDDEDLSFRHTEIRHDFNAEIGRAHV